MIRVLGIAVVLGLVGTLSVMAQEIKPGKAKVIDKGIASSKLKRDALGKKIQPQLDDRSIRFLGSIDVNPYKNISRGSTAKLKSNAIYEAEMAAWEAQRDFRNRTAGSLGAIGLAPLIIAPPPTRPIDYDR